jgi:SRSO17 transposase
MGTHDKSKAAPTHRRYGLIAAHNPQTGEMKYFISNAPANASLDAMLQAAFSRGHIEKWFERARQQAGFGAFEVRTDMSLIRHWLCSRPAMLFSAEQTHRFREKNSEDHPGASGAGCRGHRVENLATQPVRVREPDRKIERLATPQ